MTAQAALASISGSVAGALSLVPWEKAKTWEIDLDLNALQMLKNIAAWSKIGAVRAGGIQAVYQPSAIQRSLGWQSEEQDHTRPSLAQDSTGAQSTRAPLCLAVPLIALRARERPPDALRGVSPVLRLLPARTHKHAHRPRRANPHR
ncbi:hypothetical protein J7T55_008219 [Diaporthe amygdali]|uniref:uncharacterized protein n=1 Tax=Phomopsis amygdali TaxID=1214568 RepID=UPI0022FE0391|nr:uncharacterized protein J7T55_008219 [Diaporthe amygdali]KAJ0121059.1 hypothetical protein J7T55_008219 [Diaporthe amygdali]